MILADTSIWIGHWRFGNSGFADMLNDRQILVHPVVIGELACGNISSRLRTLQDLRSLPFAVEASQDEVLVMIDAHRLWGKGVGFAGAHLIASAILSNCRLLTDDQRLADAARSAGAKVLIDPATH